ncbi:hypothetical protein D3C84_1045540 [compost metagenome]
MSLFTSSTSWPFTSTRLVILLTREKSAILCNGVIFIINDGPKISTLKFPLLFDLIFLLASACRSKPPSNTSAKLTPYKSFCAVELAEKIVTSALYLESTITDGLNKAP